jgi:hypothetical protein
MAERGSLIFVKRVPAASWFHAVEIFQLHEAVQVDHRRIVPRIANGPDERRLLATAANSAASAFSASTQRVVKKP